MYRWFFFNYWIKVKLTFVITYTKNAHLGHPKRYLKTTAIRLVCAESKEMTILWIVVKYNRSLDPYSVNVCTSFDSIQSNGNDND